MSGEKTQSTTLGGITNLDQLIALRTREAPEAILAHEPEGSVLTCAEFDARVERFAARLRGAGVRPGDRVATYLAPSTDLLAWLFACWRTNCCAVPNNMALQVPEIRHVLRDSSCRVLISSGSEKAEALAAAAEDGIPVWDSVDSRDSEALADVGTAGAGSAEDCMVGYTSGSTGQPKGALRSHRSVIETMRAQAEGMVGDPGPLDLKDSQPPNLICLPITNSGGVFAALFALWAGRSVAIMTKFRPEEFVDLAGRYGITNTFLTPTMYQMLLQLPEGVQLPSALRFGLSGGAPLPPAVAQRFEERFGVPIIQTYGQTESGFIAGGDPRDLKNGVRKPGAVGKPYPGVEVRIVAEDGQVCAEGEMGEITCRSGGFIDQYLNHEAASSNKIVDGWMYTGDLGYLDQDGYLYVVGRKGDMMICGGYNVYPAELEEALLRHEAVAEAVVSSLPDERLGEIPHALVKPRPSSSATGLELLEFARTQLAAWKAPRSLQFVDDFPRLDERGKIARNQLTTEWRDAHAGQVVHRHSSTGSWDSR